MNWYLNALKKYAVFSGRACRMEYWVFFLVNVSIAVAGNVGGRVFHSLLFALICFVYGLAVLLPGLAVAVRRLHDVNRSAWWLLLALVPIVGLVLIIFMVQDGEPGENKYGENPKLIA